MDRRRKQNHPWTPKHVRNKKEKKPEDWFARRLVGNSNWWPGHGPTSVAQGAGATASLNCETAPIGGATASLSCETAPLVVPTLAYVAATGVATPSTTRPLPRPSVSQPVPKPSKRTFETVRDDATTVIDDVNMLEFAHSMDVGKKIDTDVVIQLAKHQFEKEAAASHEMGMRPTERKKWRVRAGKKIQTARVRAALLELGYGKCV